MMESVPNKIPDDSTKVAPVNAGEPGLAVSSKELSKHEFDEVQERLKHTIEKHDREVQLFTVILPLIKAIFIFVAAIVSITLVGLLCGRSPWISALATATMIVAAFILCMLVQNVFKHDQSRSEYEINEMLMSHPLTRCFIEIVKEIRSR